ncbi:vomeronasal type-1 receptor 4-like [Macrotis lagotis]|uniref:LOW QUALITY PROTEIN: vomeronasal type-1 receptor 4-like n=1 Tax=Macrotis lagotis TaxID=92651 RepID=UPI003D68A6E8
MYLYNIVVGVIFFSQIGVGVLGNSCFLYCYGFTLFRNHRSRPMEPIVVQLMLSNTIVLLSQGCPLALFHLEKGYFLGNAGCKMLFYLQRVSRGHSLCTSSLLSAFQAITISPSHSSLAKFKVRVPKFIIPSCLLCWIVNLLIEMSVPIYLTESRNINTSHGGRTDFLYCHTQKVFKELAIFPSLRDMLLVGCMVFTSSYMIFSLYRHHQRVHHIYSSCLAPRIFPEVKATQTILLLMSIFVTAYCISCGFTLYKVYMINSGAWVFIVSTFISLCFPTISPFLLIHRDLEPSRSCCAPWKRPRL